MPDQCAPDFNSGAAAWALTFGISDTLGWAAARDSVAAKLRRQDYRNGTEAVIKALTYTTDGYAPAARMLLADSAYMALRSRYTRTTLHDYIVSMLAADEDNTGSLAAYYSSQEEGNRDALLREANADQLLRVAYMADGGGFIDGLLAQTGGKDLLVRGAGRSKEPEPAGLCKSHLGGRRGILQIIKAWEQTNVQIMN